LFIFLFSVGKEGSCATWRSTERTKWNCQIRKALVYG